ncbi:MAG: LamG domain-containing protein [Candidatus Poribacteria bacterium]|nr:LamG domain-containing protein [Candidatus Poribacteria bacterium]
MKKLIYPFISLLTVAAFCHSGYTEAVVTDGLVSYWTFDQQDIADNTVIDVWGENDATIVGDPQVVAGQVKDALEFDGSDDYVNLTNLGDFGSHLGTSTFDVWIKTSFKRDWTTLFKVIDRDCSMGWGLDLNASSHFDQIVFKKDAISRYIRHKLGENGCKSSTAGTLVSIFDGKWHHIVHVNDTYVDKAGLELREQSLYIDGELHTPGLTNVTALDTFIPFVEAVYLGAGNNRGKAEGFFRGRIDEVRIYNRPLTHAEVRQNFEMGLSVEPVQKLPTVWGALKTKL